MIRRAVVPLQLRTVEAAGLLFEARTQADLAGAPAGMGRQFSTSGAQVRHRYAGRLIGVPRTDRTQVASGGLLEEMR